MNNIFSPHVPFFIDLFIDLRSREFIGTTGFRPLHHFLLICVITLL